MTHTPKTGRLIVTAAVGLLKIGACATLPQLPTKREGVSFHIVTSRE